MLRETDNDVKAVSVGQRAAVVSHVTVVDRMSRGNFCTTPFVSRVWPSLDTHH